MSVSSEMSCDDPLADEAAIDAGVALRAQQADSLRERIGRIAERLVEGGLQGVITHGRDFERHVADSMDDMLDAVRTGELGQIGAKLSLVMGNAHSLSPVQAASGRGAPARSGALPWLGALLGRLRSPSAQARARAQQIGLRIDELLSEVQALQGGLQQRGELLADAIDALNEEPAMLALQRDACEQASGLLRQRLARSTRGNDIEPAALAMLADQRATLSAIGERIGEIDQRMLIATELLALLRSVQSNNRRIIARLETLQADCAARWRRAGARAEDAGDALLEAVGHAVGATREGLQLRAAVIDHLQRQVDAVEPLAEAAAGS